MRSLKTLAPLWIVAFVGVIAGFRMWDPTLPMPRIMAGNDLPAYFIPSVSFLHRSLWSGEFPLWNPHQMAGTPFVALHSPAAAYPLLFPLALLPPHVALTVHALLHLCLAGLFTFGFLRRLDVGLAGAVAGGIAYAGSAPLIDALHNTAYLSTYVWLPAVFWALEAAMRRPTTAAMAALASAVAAGFLAGHAQAFVYIVQVSGIYAIFRLVAVRPRTTQTRALGVLLGAGVAAGGLVAFQLLATVGHASGGVRDLGGLSLMWAGGSTHTFDNMLPGLVGRGARTTNLSFLTIPLALAGLASKRSRAVTLFFVVAAVLVLDFIRGKYGVVFPIYYGLPGGNLFRFPPRAAFVYQFAAAALIGLGSSAVVSYVQSRWARFAGVAWLLPAAVAVNVYVLNPLAYRFLPTTAPFASPREEKLSGFLSGVGFDRTFVQHGFGDVVRVKFGTQFGGYTLPDYDPMLPGEYGEFFGRRGKMMWHGRLELLEVLGRSRRLLVVEPALLDLLGVRYYAYAVTGRGMPPASELGKVAGAKPVGLHGVQLYARDTALPRAYVVHGVVEVADEEQALEVTRHRAFDARREAVVVGIPERPAPAGPGAEEWARITAYRANRVEVEAHCESRCLIVLSDLYTPDWVAFVDGRPAEVHRVNYLVRGVLMDPGSRRIDFRYRPRALTIGLPLSLGTLGVLMALVIRGRRRDEAVAT